MVLYTNQFSAEVFRNQNIFFKSSALVCSQTYLYISNFLIFESPSYFEVKCSTNLFSVSGWIPNLSLYYLIHWVRVSQSSSQEIIPVLTERGKTFRVTIFRDLKLRFSFFLNKSFTKLRNCITLSSYRISSFPFNKKKYFLLLIPYKANLRGFLLDCKTFNTECIFLILISEEHPGTNNSLFLKLSKSLETFSK